MDLGDFETTVKVIVVGNGGVGKSSMTSRYCRGVFTSTYKKTIGVDFLEKTIEVDESGGETVKLMIWDTAGQEEFDALTASYYRGTGACALVFSTVDRASFENIEKWKKKVEDECGPVVMCLVQNKVDLIDEAMVTPAEVEALARRLKMRLYRTCVKDNLNVTEVFEYLAAQFILKGGAASGSVPAVAAVGDMGPEGGHRMAAAGAGEEEDLEGDGGEGGGGGGGQGQGGGSGSGGSGGGGKGGTPAGASPNGKSPARVGSPRSAAAAGQGAGGGAAGPKPPAPASGKERVIDLSGNLEAVVEGGVSKRVGGNKKKDDTIKLGKDGRRVRPDKKCC